MEYEKNSTGSIKSPHQGCRSHIQIVLIAIIVFGLFVSSCVKRPEQLFENWSYVDLRTMDTIDADAQYNDLIAAYNRIESDHVQIRLDFLDIAPEVPIDIQLAFDYKPGGSEQMPFNIRDNSSDFKWDALLNIPAINNPMISCYNGVMSSVPELKVYRDSFLDAIFISIPSKFIEKSTNYKFLALAGVNQNIDINTDFIGPIQANAPSPQALPVLIAFWDVFQSATPAQALRSWDGAHTGPDSSRHGLRHLLDAADIHKTSLLLYLDDQDSFYTALDYIGISDKLLELIRKSSVEKIEFINYIDHGYAHFSYINYPDSATKEGLSKKSIIQLLSLSNTNANREFIVLGGSFQNSTWGSPDAVGPTLDYISNHPWIRVVDFHDRLQQAYNDVMILNDYQFLTVYNAIKPNLLREFALATYNSLSQHGGTKHDQIRVTYINQVGHILAAAEWLNSPHPISNCSTDIDWDGEIECVLASENIFTTYELYGGYLAFAFANISGRPHQIIGPTYQLSVDLNNAGSLNTDNALYTDPSQILGALADPPSKQLLYSYAIIDNKIDLFGLDMAIRKSFELTKDSISMEINHQNQNHNYQIPFIIDPWNMYRPHWPSYYSVDQINDHWRISVNDAFTAKIHSSGRITVSSSLAPMPAMLFPEDPNYDYTRGYFLPFPMILLEINSSDAFQANIQIYPCP